MGTYADLNITIRREDRMPITESDLNAYEEFFSNTYGNSCTSTSPHISNDGNHIHSFCEVKWGFETSEMKPFAVSNPHLQIEVMEVIEADDTIKNRYLFHGENVEILEEISVMEEPQIIDWPSYHAGKEYELGRRLRALQENKKFAHFIGRRFRREFLGSPATDWHLGENIIGAYLGGRLDELLLAVIEMDMEELLSAWEESQTHQEVTE